MIDWQYLSIAGVGEDLGKMFGVVMSQDDFPIDEAWNYQESVFNSYLEGLNRADWNGNAMLPRLGFCLSVAFRSAWELPKLIKLHADNAGNALDKQIEKYTQIVHLQMRLKEEADGIIVKL